VKVKDGLEGGKPEDNQEKKQQQLMGLKGRGESRKELQAKADLLQVQKVCAARVVKAERVTRAEQEKERALTLKGGEGSKADASLWASAPARR